ncbi:arginine--tRNA ligase [Nanoarchaeota archaeon]
MKEILEAIKKVVKTDVSLEVPPDMKMGDYAFPCFPLAKIYKKNPVEIAKEVSKKIKKPKSVEKIEVNGPYINFFLNKSDLSESTIKDALKDNYGKKSEKKSIMIEFPSPNTNKPLHLGHLRNIFIGQSVSNYLEFLGNSVVKVNLINDRGIHICKSMLAYQKWGKNKEPNKKSDHFVGDFYVLYSKKEDDKLKAEAQEMLVNWEKGDPELRKLWKKMNTWAVKGFDETFKSLGLKFKKQYFESDIYDKGKHLIQHGLEKGIFYKNDDGAIIIDLEKEGLGEKVLLRADNTALYITQDLYLAHQKFKDFKINRSIYVVGSEQEYHFKVLKNILKKLNFEHSDDVLHLSYGMVFLPEGKMKSREGKVVDADDIIEELISMSKEEIKKRYPKLSKAELESRSKKIGLSALKFYLLKNDPSKSIIFKPEESISFEGETGPYIQYTYARISSILRKFGKDIPKKVDYTLLDKDIEKRIIKLLSDYPSIVEEAGEKLKIHLVPRFLLELSQAFNEYYHEYQILQEKPNLRNARLLLISAVRNTIKSGLNLLDIETIEKM